MPETLHRLAIPTPFMVGRVNCYLVDDDPLTLVDTGPNSGTALTELEAALGAHGRRVEDLERIVLTHQHIDHIGLTQILADRSGAEVCALDALAPWLAEYGRSMEEDDRYAEAIMARHGIPQDVRYALRAVSTQFRAWGAGAQVTRPLHDGGTLEFASRSWAIHHRPGHSPSDTVFHDAAAGELIGGDHLIAKISSNPLISRPLGGAEGERPQALRIYLDSLARTREMPLLRVWPGHGDVVEDHAALIDERGRLHARRAEKLHALILERPRSAYELAQAMWGNVAVTQAYLTLSEVLGHTDLLLNEGRVREVEDGSGDDAAPVVRFESDVIAFNGRAAARPELGGVERFARELATRLDARVLQPPPALSHRAGHLWEQAALPLLARGADVLLNPANLAPLAFPRNVVIVHDAAVLREPAWYSPAYVRWQRFVLPRIARRALRVLTVSAFSRDELRALLGVDAAVVPGGVDHDRFVPGAPRTDRPYVLTVASRTARKNLAALAETQRRLAAQGIELLAAGGGRPQFAGEADLPVRMLGHVPDEELPALYAGASAFVLPSLYEGFGLPCLEAMACGVPVVCSDRGALPDTCGGAALLVDPRDQGALAEAVVAAVGDAELRARGLRRAAEFSWDRTVAELAPLLAAA